MDRAADILIIGGGVAGLSAAAALSARAKVTVLEAEPQTGFHSSGRSATMMHYALGDGLIRALTQASRPFFDAPPEGFSDVPLGHRMPVLVHARQSELGNLDALASELSEFTQLDRLDAAQVLALCPILKDAAAGIADRNGLRLDTHALLQGYSRQLRANGGRLVTDARVRCLERVGDCWSVETDQGNGFEASILVNAAGAWADDIAHMAGVRPLGIRPLKRTIITFDAPEGTDLSGWPFAKTVHDELYFAPESGRLFASPMDEEPTEPCDAQADEYEVALAAQRVEERTTISVRRIHSRWAGLRSFAPDRRPVVGFAPGAPGFFWLAGQGGAGLQTSPAMASIAAALILGKDWPVPAVPQAALSPARFRG